MRALIFGIIFFLGGIFWLVWTKEREETVQDIPQQLIPQEESSLPESLPVQSSSQDQKVTPRVIQVLATNWYFEPETITVKKGEVVELQVTGGGVEHSLAVPAFNLEVIVKPDETKGIVFTPDQVGTFPILCNVYCGDGHSSMTGQLIVTEE